jgi:two-component system, OmpR family, response regulator
MKVLIVEDEIQIAQLLVKGFTEAGFQVDSSSDGNEALKLCLAGTYDLMVLDVMLPSRDGFSVLEELRKKHKDLPVIFLSAKRSTEDRIEGLKRGGDDYVVKPFSLSEVLIRAQIILRRFAKPSTENKISFQDLELDLLTRTVRRGEVKIELPQREFALLECLLSNQGQILSKTQILERVWKYDFDPQTNVVDVSICRLRNKIDRDFKTKLIRTFRGIGYSIRAE